MQLGVFSLRTLKRQTTQFLLDLCIEFSGYCRPVSFFRSGTEKCLNLISIQGDHLPRNKIVPSFDQASTCASLCDGITTALSSRRNSCTTLFLRANVTAKRTSLTSATYLYYYQSPGRLGHAFGCCRVPSTLLDFCVINRTLCLLQVPICL